MSSKISAFIAYLLLIFGWLFVMIFKRSDEFALFHARQSLRLTIFAVVIPLLWAVGGYIVSFVPFLGPIFATAMFTLVMIAAMALLIAWIAGLSNALRGKWSQVPMFGA